MVLQHTAQLSEKNPVLGCQIQLTELCLTVINAKIGNFSLSVMISCFSTYLIYKFLIYILVLLHVLQRTKLNSHSIKQSISITTTVAIQVCKKCVRIFLYNNFCIILYSEVRLDYYRHTILQLAGEGCIAYKRNLNFNYFAEAVWLMGMTKILSPTALLCSGTLIEHPHIFHSLGSCFRWKKQYH